VVFPLIGSGTEIEHLQLTELKSHKSERNKTVIKWQKTGYKDEWSGNSRIIYCDL